MLNIGDTVKVISGTQYYDEAVEFIRIGTICKVVHVGEDGIGIVPLDFPKNEPYFYWEKELEKGELVWTKSP